MRIRTCIAAFLFAGLAVLGLARCAGQIESEEPSVAKVNEERLILAELPDVLLVRRVVLQETAAEIFTSGKTRQVDEITSEFGEAGEVADLDCVVDGLKNVLPESEIVPAERFWERVVGEGEEVRLPALFEPPLAAHFGHPKARMTLASYYRRGAAPVAKDLVEAAVWYGLAERDGLSWAGTNRQGVETRLSPAERAEAGALLSRWAPNPAACRLML